jgi:hypothetical protein
MKGWCHFRTDFANVQLALHAVVIDCVSSSQYWYLYFFRFFVIIMYLYFCVLVATIIFLNEELSLTKSSNS